PLPAYSTKLSVPFFKAFSPDIGLFYIPFAILVIVGASNAVNLTDGLDGLAIGPVVVAALAYTVVAYVSGHRVFADYLLIPYIEGSGELSIFTAAIFGASLGFLWFNTYPASVFMGDVGSLPLGAALGTVAVISKHELVRLLGKFGARVAVADQKPLAELTAALEGLRAGDLEVHGSGAYESALRGAELVVVSPGVPLTLEPLRRARAAGVRVIGEFELAA